MVISELFVIGDVRGSVNNVVVVIRFVVGWHGARLDGSFNTAFAEKKKKNEL